MHTLHKQNRVHCYNIAYILNNCEMYAEMIDVNV